MYTLFSVHYEYQEKQRFNSDEHTSAKILVSKLFCKKRAWTPCKKWLIPRLQQRKDKMSLESLILLAGQLMQK